MYGRRTRTERNSCQFNQVMSIYFIQFCSINYSSLIFKLVRVSSNQTLDSQWVWTGRPFKNIGTNSPKSYRWVELERERKLPALYCSWHLISHPLLPGLFLCKMVVIWLQVFPLIDILEII